MSEKEAAEPISNYLEAKECCLNTFGKEHSQNLQKTKIINLGTYLCFEEILFSFDQF